MDDPNFPPITLDANGKRRARRNAARAYVAKYLEDHPCVRCGESDTRALSFHHRDPEKKIAGVKRMVHNGVGIPAIDAEIQKCDVVCHNCHAIIHWEEYHGLGDGE